jgi:murein L,D-transpeptidase YafK
MGMRAWNTVWFFGVGAIFSASILMSDDVSASEFVGIGRSPSAHKILPHVILVDKKKNELHVSQYQEKDSLKILHTYHTTMGKVRGDKEEEGDLKTPEGIYHFKTKVKPPQLQAKFGVMGFHMDYPNAYDRIAGRTGSAIMLHATDDIRRMNFDFDSEGCIVLNNDNILEVSKYIRLGLTPIMVFEDLKERYINGTDLDTYHKFFKSWISAWENKDIEAYMAHYHSDFEGQGKDFKTWKTYKNALNQRYHQISVGASDPYFFRHPKYTMMMFTQDYESKLKSGRVAMKSRGTKILYFAEENGKPKIITENYTERLWH